MRSLFRHRFTGKMLTTSQKWGVVETTPNHSIFDRHGKKFYPEERREIMALRHLPEMFAPACGLEAINALEGIAGFVRDEVRVTASGGKMTRPCREGWASLDLPRHATAVQAVYDPLCDVQPLEDLITVLVWYATEGHVNGRNGGIVITQANRDELERVRAACARITTGKGSIDFGTSAIPHGGCTWDPRRFRPSPAIIAASIPSTSGFRTSCSGSRRRTCNTPSTN